MTFSDHTTTGGVEGHDPQIFWTLFWTLIFPAIICLVLCKLTKVIWYVIIAAAVVYYTLLAYFHFSGEDPHSVFGPQLKWVKEETDEISKKLGNFMNHQFEAKTEEL